MRAAVMGNALLLIAALVAPARSQGASDFEIESKMCDMGSPLSCEAAGTYAMNGSGGVARDPARAAGFWRRACDGGQMAGCRGLGILHAVGAGVTQDFARAETLFRRACSGGDAESCPLADKARRDLAQANAAPPAPPPAAGPPSRTAPPAPVAERGSALKSWERGSERSRTKLLDPATMQPCIKETGRETIASGKYVRINFHNSCDRTITVWYDSDTAALSSTGAWGGGDTHATVRAEQMDGFDWWVK